MDEVLSLYETLDMFMVLVIGLLSALIGKNFFLPFAICIQGCEGSGITPVIGSGSRF
jgi:hypothetical protein